MSFDQQPQSAPYRKDPANALSAGPGNLRVGSEQAQVPQPRFTNVGVPSFSAFRRKLHSAQESFSTLRRTGSVNAVPLSPSHLSSFEKAKQDVLLDRRSRPSSLDDPRNLQSTLRSYTDTGSATLASEPQPHPDPSTDPSSLEASIASRVTHYAPTKPQLGTFYLDEDETRFRLGPAIDFGPAKSQTTQGFLANHSKDTRVPDEDAAHSRDMSSEVLMRGPPLTIQVDDNSHDPLNDDSLAPGVIQPSNKPTKAQGNLASFFNWKRPKSPDGPDFPATPMTDSRSMSPSASPLLAAQMQNGVGGSPSSSFNYPRGTASNDNLSPTSSPGAYGTRSGQAVVTHVDELMNELRELSAELAASIRREMELEDEVDKCKLEMPPTSIENRRTSDYYSDSGASSVRYPTADSETKIEGLEKMRRKAEQEKAQLRLDMAQRTQDEVNQRRALEMHVQTLEEQLQHHNSDEGTEREKELELAIEDHKRRLSEERLSKQNLEELHAGMQRELELHRNERDNLRDEVVPQLRARVEGLESSATEMQALGYEHSRMQQELQNLKNENQTLLNARKLQLDMQQQQPQRFRTIAEEDEPTSPISPSSGLTRSNSLARSRSVKKRPSSLVKSGGMDELASQMFVAGQEHQNDIEAQRDALQRTLKSLIIRQDHLTKQHAKQVRALEIERNRALNGTQRRLAYHFEVQHLRQAVDELKQRADEASEQKWQCEKNLSGLKMDLDRAQQETASLRELLQERDIFLPDRPSSSDSATGADATESLGKAFDDLRRTRADSVARLQAKGQDGQQLLQTSDERMKHLSTQIEAQLSANDDLRRRLADAINRGVAEQEASAKKIVGLESALRGAEDKVVAAQSVSEDAIAQQEEHVKSMSSAAGEKRLRGLYLGRIDTFMAKAFNSIADAGSSKQPLTPLFSARPPRLDSIDSAVTPTEASRTRVLEERVRELETEAAKAEQEIRTVVEAMNRAQMDVAQLQTERDEAMRQTRRLQREILEERERCKALVAEYPSPPDTP